MFWRGWEFDRWMQCPAQAHRWVWVQEAGRLFAGSGLKWTAEGWVRVIGVTQSYDPAELDALWSH